MADAFNPLFADGDREELNRWLLSSTIRARLDQRARIVLLAAAPPLIAG